MVFSALSVEYFYRLVTNKPIRDRDVGPEFTGMAIPSPGSSVVSFSKPAPVPGTELPRHVIPLISGIAFSITCLFIRYACGLLPITQL